MRAALKTLAGRPGPTRAAVDDIQSQLARLVPPDLMRVTPAGRLGHLTRYLKAIQVRLQRLSHDPQKDQQKAAQVAPFWQSYQNEARRAAGQGLRSSPSSRSSAGCVEELRVQTFAPELKTAVPVSAQRLHDLWSRFAR